MGKSNLKDINEGNQCKSNEYKIKLKSWKRGEAQNHKEIICFVFGKGYILT